MRTVRLGFSLYEDLKSACYMAYFCTYFILFIDLYLTIRNPFSP